MNIRRDTILFLAALTAAAGCTSAVSKDPKVNGGEAVSDDKNPDDKNPDDKNPDDKNPDDKNPDDKNPDDKSETSVDVAVGSVLLRNDCRDTPVIDPSVPASIAPAAPAKRVPPTSPGVTAPSAARRPAGLASRTCQQSTLQITFDNRGDAAAAVSVVAAMLRDVETDHVVATLPSRKPSKWSEADNAYADWDQNVAASSSVRTSYRITPPSWSEVEAKLGGESSRGRTYDVEVSLKIDGAPVTARSPEFTRPPLVPMPPT